MTSDNQFTKRSFTKSSNTFTDKSFSKGSTPAVIRVFSKGSAVWNGENLSGGIFGLGDPFGGPSSSFGIGEFSGIAHYFVKRQGSVTH